MIQDSGYPKVGNLRLFFASAAICVEGSKDYFPEYAVHTGLTDTALDTELQSSALEAEPVTSVNANLSSFSLAPLPKYQMPSPISSRKCLTFLRFLSIKSKIFEAQPKAAILSLVHSKWQIRIRNDEAFLFASQMSRLFACGIQKIDKGMLLFWLSKTKKKSFR